MSQEDAITEQPSGNPQPKRKGLLARLLELLDKKLEEQARQQPCCGKPKDKQNSSCC